MRVLTHICCGPCFTAVHEILASSGHRLGAYYFNPNIQPVGEYRRRLAYVAAFCSFESVDLSVGSYNISEFFKNAVGYTDKQDRCRRCYRLRLMSTALSAAQNDFDAFTTTLLLSPWQFHDELKTVAQEIGDSVGVRFLYRDFRPAYRRSVEISRARGMYRQKYCGCLFSDSERHTEITSKLKIAIREGHSDPDSPKKSQGGRGSES
ncbi:MAG TPA: epoxyqueuosine reductase QueH [Actinobacteria bacterium]|nr:epoxyqueuosine reductase QueH [Actinomycetota bacterium]